MNEHTPIAEDLNDCLPGYLKLGVVGEKVARLAASISYQMGVIKRMRFTRLPWF